MNKKFKEDFIALFNEGFEKVVLPVLDDMHEEIKGIKGDVAGIKVEIVSLKSGQDRIERKVDKVIDKNLEQGNLLANHDKRIGKLEKLQTAT